jgi:hypothetical protein
VDDDDDDDDDADHVAMMKMIDGDGYTYGDNNKYGD